MGVAESIFAYGCEKTSRGESSRLAERPANRAEWGPDFGAALREKQAVQGKGG